MKNFPLYIRTSVWYYKVRFLKKSHYAYEIGDVSHGRTNLLMH